MKKGFTLIELLAVILILGIIALIAIPTVNEIIEDSKKGALKSSVSNIVNSVEQQCNIERMRSNAITNSYSITDGVISSDINIKNLPKGGSINVDNDCNAEVAITDGKYCVIQKGDNVVINSNASNCNLDYIITPDTESSCFIFDEDTRTITGYHFEDESCPSSVVIPATINNIPVENIGDLAFVDIEDYIPLYSMFDNRSSIAYSDIIKENLEVYDLELAGILDLIKLTPNTKKKCFNSEVRLNSEMVEENLNYIGTPDDNYDGCRITTYDKKTSLGKIQLVDFTKAINLKTIGDGAFMNNRISTIYFDNNRFTYIGNSVFANNLLEEIDLTGFIYQRISNSMFRNNSISEIIYNNNITSIGKYAFNNNAIITYNLPSSLTSIDSAAFYMNNYESADETPVLTIPDSVVSIGGAAFIYNNINTLNLGTSVKYIQKDAFFETNIKTINFNEGLENIGKRAFANNQLTKIELPTSIKNLGAGCFNRNKVTSQANGAFIFKIENGVLYDDTLISFAGPENANSPIYGIKTIAEGTFTNVNFSQLSLHDVEVIEDYAIDHIYMKKAKIDIGSSITSIGPNSFKCDDSQYCNHTITIDKPENSIPGAPWGNPYATINWTGTN